MTRSKASREAEQFAIDMIWKGGPALPVVGMGRKFYRYQPHLKGYLPVHENEVLQLVPDLHVVHFFYDLLPSIGMDMKKKKLLRCLVYAWPQRLEAIRDAGSGEISYREVPVPDSAEEREVEDGE